MTSNGFDIRRTPIFETSDSQILFDYFARIIEANDMNPMFEIATALGDPKIKIHEFKGATYAVMMLLYFEEQIAGYGPMSDDIEAKIDAVFENLLRDATWIDKIENPALLFYKQRDEKFPGRVQEKFHIRFDVKEYWDNYIKSLQAFASEIPDFEHYFQYLIDTRQIMEGMKYLSDILNEPTLEGLACIESVIEAAYRVPQYKVAVIKILETMAANDPGYMTEHPVMAMLLDAVQKQFTDVAHLN